MADFEACHGCSCQRQGLTTSPNKSSFSKKLLVATCIAVIITMCLTPTEAASLAHKKHRKQLESMTLTKDTEVPSEVHMRHKRRHQRDQPKITKDSLEIRPNDHYEEEMNKIIRKIRNTLRNFNQHKYKVNDSKEYRNPKVKVPTTNFVEVRFHNYKHGRAGSTLLQRKFSYIIPKLYKSLANYLEIFKSLDKMQVVDPDVPFKNKYEPQRKQFLRETITNLQSSLGVISDKLNDFNIAEPHVNKTRIHLEDFKTRVTVTQCLEYDGTVFRSYGIILNKWFCIVSTKDTRTRKQNLKCSKIEDKMREKKHNRRLKTRKRATAV